MGPAKKAKLIDQKTKEKTESLPHEVDSAESIYEGAQLTLEGQLIQRVNSNSSNGSPLFQKERDITDADYATILETLKNTEAEIKDHYYSLGEKHRFFINKYTLTNVLHSLTNHKVRCTYLSFEKSLSALVCAVTAHFVKCKQAREDLPGSLTLKEVVNIDAEIEILSGLNMAYRHTAQEIQEAVDPLWKIELPDEDAATGSFKEEVNNKRSRRKKPSAN